MLGIAQNTLPVQASPLHSLAVESSQAPSIWED